ncbi:MAG: GNAT family N-acetyltransferase [Elusimicrobia bacterium]|nr:GNAT family N-acetyltransferase [Elusimicrobiota bacterium]
MKRTENKAGIGPEKLLLEAAGSWIREVSYGFQGEKISTAAMKKAARALKKIINGGSPELFVSYAIENGRLLWFWVSKTAPDDFEGRIIIVRPFIMAPELIENGFIKELAASARKFHKAKNLKVQIGIAPSESAKIKLCENQGFKLAYHALSGKVSTSLRAVATKKHALPPGYDIRPVDMRREMHDYLRMSIRALKSDSTSSMYNVPVARIRKTFLKYLKKKNVMRIFGLYFNGVLAGNITVSVEKGVKKTGLLGNIGILPEHTGKGFSSNLYYAGLSWFKAHGVARYMGISSTKRVLSMIKPMNRRVAVSYLKM